MFCLCTSIIHSVYQILSSFPPSHPSFLSSTFFLHSFIVQTDFFHLPYIISFPLSIPSFHLYSFHSHPFYKPNWINSLTSLPPSFLPSFLPSFPPPFLSSFLLSLISYLLHFLRPSLINTCFGCLPLSRCHRCLASVGSVESRCSRWRRSWQRKLPGTRTASDAKNVTAFWRECVWETRANFDLCCVVSVGTLTCVVSISVWCVVWHSWF